MRRPRARPLSARYLIALGARIVREIAGLTRRAEQQDKRLAVLAIDTQIRFRSAADRAAFASELAAGAVGCCECRARLIQSAHRRLISRQGKPA